MSEQRRQWVIMKPEDDVATALTALEAGRTIQDEEAGISVTLKQSIPFGHKFALHDIALGQPVHKYGQVIGSATKPIEQGEHVHVHNVDSNRARGDLAKERAE